MATSKNNVITHGLSGKVGDLLVFSQRNGKTIVSRMPRKVSVLSNAQIAQNEKFTMAASYAKAAIQDPVLKLGYQEQAEIRNISPYNCAMGDYLNAPEINQIITTGYSGNIGDKILIRATDDFSVESVEVRIEKADGSLIEEGNATQHPFHWEYTTTANNGNLVGSKIMITAKDLPQNETHKEITL